ncbi:MAG TPA: hypothetical protein VGX68_12690 [Thermoanaerobaculia bacterium]|jgi:hypothetical protein|nr:hypothetical protein [Thermoanaerobaculia bacterium]
MTKRIGITLMGLLFALSTAAVAQERVTGSRAAIEKLLTEYVQQLDTRSIDQDFQLKGVPRTDKAEATVVGTVTFVDGTDFLDDGTPFRIVEVRAKKPFDQFVYIACLGSSFNSSCGRLPAGRRVSFTSDILVIEDGESAGLALFVAKKLQS